MDVINKIIDTLAINKKTQKDLTDYLGMQNSVFTKWKAGTNTSYLKHISKIAEFLNVSTDYLLGKTDIKNKPTTNSGELEEMDLLTKEIMETISKLSPEGQKLALSQLRALLGFEEKKDK